MIHETKFSYTPSEHEAEKASNSYLMSLVALIAGLPLPIINLLASFIFYLNHRKGTYFVRWHCTQALISQIPLFFINSVCFWWTIAVLYTPSEPTVYYFSYLSIVLLLNLIEFIATIYTAIQARKGIHVEWWIFADLTNKFCQPKKTI